MRSNIGQYRVEGVLGRGGMGVVYRGVHDQLGREVAIKALAPELTQQPEFKARFFAEAKTQARLQHPNIVAVYDLLEDAGEFFIVMELVAGEGLDDRLRRAAESGGRGMELDTAFALFSQVLAALDYAHSEGVIHRDVKPSNVMITANGRVKLTDFGIALLVGDKRLTASQAAIGTPTYMSPEQILRPRSVDHRTDLYSAAVVFYEMLAGRPPFDDESEYGIKRLHVEAPPPDLAVLNPALPPGLIAAIAVALNKNPDDRFSSAGAFLRALQEVLPLALPPGVTPLPQPILRPSVSDLPPQVTKPPVVAAVGPPSVRLPGRRFWIALGAAAVALAVGAGSTLLYLAKSSPPEMGPVVQNAGSPPPALPATALPRPAAAPVAALPPAPPPVPQPVEVVLTESSAGEPPAPRRATRVDVAPAVAPPPAVAAASPSAAGTVPPALDVAEPKAQPQPEPAPSANTEPGDLFARLGEMESVVVALERLSEQTQEAYEEEGQETELGPRLEEFVEAASGVRRAFRKTTGKGLGALRDRVLKRASQEADRSALSAQAKDLVRRGAQIDGLLAQNPMGPGVMGPWKEVRHNLDQLDAFFR